MNTPRYQRGVMALMMAILLIGLLSILSLITVAQYYWAKRDAQKVADMAALSGVQHIDNQLSDNGCANAAQAASVIGKANWGTTAKTSITPTCGNWNPATNASVAPKTYFVAGASSSANAVQVIASTTPTTIIPESIAGKAFQVSAKAVATQSDPVAAFSVGSQLLELNNSGLVPGVLKELGLDVGGTKLLGYNGLANIRITPAGLLKALCNEGGPCIDITTIADVGTLNQTLAGKHVEIGKLLNAMLDIANQQNVDQTTIDALNNLLTAQAKITGPTLVQLGSTSETNRGLFAQIEATSVNSALNANVSALSIVNTALQVANSHHFVDLSNLSIPGVELKASVIEPPSIAVGGKGTTAYTAQIRVGLQIDSDALPALGGLLKALGVRINLPIVLDVVSGQATIDSLCGSDPTDQSPPPIVAFDANSTILGMCMGNYDMDNLPSTTASCDNGLSDTTFVSVLDMPIMGGKMYLPALSGGGELYLPEGGYGHVDANLNIGDAMADLTKGILSTLLGNDSTQQNGKIIGGQVDNPGSTDLNKIASSLWANADCAHEDTNTGRKDCMTAIKNSFNTTVSNETQDLIPGLIDGLLKSVNDILEGVFTLAAGNGCTTSGLLGGILNPPSSAGCISILKSSLQQDQQTGSGATITGAVLMPVAQLADVLRPILNTVGNTLLKPLLETLLGDTPGQTDVHLMSLQCHGAQLVY